MSMDRRSFLMMLGAASLAQSASALPMFKGDAKAFSRTWLEDEAERLSKVPYAPMPEVPKAWRDLKYDQYRSLAFDPSKSLWSDTALPFHMDFFHPGLYFPRAVEINIVENDMARMLGFDMSLFEQREGWPEDMPVDETMGYSGLRLRNELNNPGVFDEFLVYQGASYFRAIGAGQNYGLSARGLALKTGDPEGEEFPEFTRFWVEEPEPGALEMTVHALLDSPSTTGAYSFVITPGLPATCQVQATLFPREALPHVGIAPLTSMFLFDETNRARFDDFRSAVHDSEGLLIWNGAGEIIWRPLANHSTLQVASFVDENPRGFGLMQRERDLAKYADLEAHYHNRPSLWITPSEDWGKGAITLVEIPADKEIYDNIVAYWRPRDPLAGGSRHDFSYKMDWGLDPQPLPLARVIDTRIGKSYDKAKPYIIVAIDFEPHTAFETDDLNSLTRFISSNRGTVSEGILQSNPATGGVRLGFKFEPGDQTIAEMRVQLLSEGNTISEVWLYRWSA